MRISLSEGEELEISHRLPSQFATTLTVIAKDNKIHSERD